MLDAGAIKELERLVLNSTKPVEINGISYWPRGHAITPPKVEVLTVHSLEAFADYISSGQEMGLVELKDWIVHVVGFQCVELVGHPLDPWNTRERLVTAEAIVPKSKIGEFMTQEAFAIWVASEFVDSSDRKDLLKVAGNIKAEKLETSRDDGVSQEAVVRAGVASLEKELVKMTWYLSPWRTFSDIEQPGGNFLFRLREGHAGVEMALFSISEGDWRLQAMKDIKAYLVDHLGNDWTVLA